MVFDFPIGIGTIAIGTDVRSQSIKYSGIIPIGEIETNTYL